MLLVLNETACSEDSLGNICWPWEGPIIPYSGIRGVYFWAFLAGDFLALAFFCAGFLAAGFLAAAFLAAGFGFLVTFLACLAFLGDFLAFLGDFLAFLGDFLAFLGDFFAFFLGDFLAFLAAFARRKLPDAPVPLFCISLPSLTAFFRLRRMKGASFSASHV